MNKKLFGVFFFMLQISQCHRRIIDVVRALVMASILGDGSGPGGPGTSRCLLLLQRSLAIQLTRGPPPHVANASQRESPKEHPADEMWMYDKGYNLFQVGCAFIYIFIYTLLIPRYPFFYREFKQFFTVR